VPAGLGILLAGPPRGWPPGEYGINVICAYDLFEADGIVHVDDAVGPAILKSAAGLSFLSPPRRLSAPYFFRRAAVSSEPNLTRCAVMRIRLISVFKAGLLCQSSPRNIKQKKGDWHLFSPGKKGAAAILGECRERRLTAGARGTNLRWIACGGHEPWNRSDITSFVCDQEEGRRDSQLPGSRGRGSD